MQQKRLLQLGIIDSLVIQSKVMERARTKKGERGLTHGCINLCGRVRYDRNEDIGRCQNKRRVGFCFPSDHINCNWEGVSLCRNREQGPPSSVVHSFIHLFIHSSRPLLHSLGTTWGHGIKTYSSNNDFIKNISSPYHTAIESVVLPWRNIIHIYGVPTNWDRFDQLFWVSYLRGNKWWSLCRFLLLWFQHLSIGYTYLPVDSRIRC